LPYHGRMRQVWLHDQAARICTSHITPYYILHDSPYVHFKNTYTHTPYTSHTLHATWQCKLPASLPNKHHFHPGPPIWGAFWPLVYLAPDIPPKSRPRH
jgi:hypothetical protein